jgi:hypothetical protein
MSEKIYVGSGKKSQDFARKISICLTDLPKEHIFEFKGKKYIKLEVVDKKQPDQFGKDVSVSIDTWKPEPKAAPAPPPLIPTQAPDDDLPF